MPTATPTQPPLIYEQIKRRLAQRIGQEWKAGHQLPPVSVLAREMRCGVSNTHRALRALADEGLLVSRPRRGTFVADAVESPAASVEPRRSTGVASTGRGLLNKKVYLPIGEDRDGMVLRMADAMLERLYASGCAVERGPGSRQLAPDFTDVDADAIVLVQTDVLETIRYRDDQAIIMVNTCDEIPQAMSRGYDVVSVDQVQGGILAGEHLRKLGVTSACFIQFAGPRAGHPTQLDELRLAGFEQGFGRPIPPEHRLLCKTYSTDSAANHVANYLKFDPRPQAVFTSCDEYAVGFLVGAAALGLEPRRDYQLVGFDGQARGKKLELGPLTTVAVPAEAMGVQAAEYLISRLENPGLPPRRTALGCSMFEGNTTRRIGDPA